jgi:Cu-Zn family superoxide dismutase
MGKQKITISAFALSAVAVIFLSFSSIPDLSSGSQDTQKITKAICVLYPTQGNQVTGIVTFTQMGDGIHVVADIHGLSKGKHGFHIHEFGDCSAPDGTSTGGHFNPDKMEHGGPMASMRHAGDMGNIEADENGNAHLDYMDPLISFEGKNSIIGRGIIVHASEDDLRTQPTGAAGARIAYGVIGIAKGE